MRPRLKINFSILKLAWNESAPVFHVTQRYISYVDVSLRKPVNDVRQERRAERAPALDSARNLFPVLITNKG